MIQKKIEKQFTVTDTIAPPTVSDSLEEIKKQLEYGRVIDGTIKNKLQYKTFSSTISTEYSDDKNKKLHFTIYLRMTRDSLIWMSLNVFGIEIYRISIQKDDLTLLDKFSKKAFVKKLSELEAIYGVPISFNLLQSIVLGEVFNLGSDLINIQCIGSELSYTTKNEKMTSTVGIFLNDTLINFNSFEYYDALDKYSCDIYYSNYVNVNDLEKKISSKRKIILKHTLQSFITLVFRNVKVNEDLKYPMGIPNNFMVIK